MSCRICFFPRAGYRHSRWICWRRVRIWARIEQALVHE